MHDPNKDISNQIIKFIKREVKKRNAKVVVVGISGGIDSAVTTTLAVRALGSKKVLGLILPDFSVTPKIDVKDAIELVKWLKIKHKVIELKDIRRQILQHLPKNKLAGGNMLVRLRMMYLYYFATVLNGIVIGTADKSELTLGYFTKYGDGAVDLQPIADLYKTQVKSLATFLGIPENIVMKESSARLWKGHTAEGELGLGYDEIDTILMKLDANSQIKDCNLKRKARRVKELIKKSGHKKEMPIICNVNILEKL
jgi:NAD+ synthase